MADVILAYRRDGEVCNGQILRDTIPITAIVNMPFHKMISALSKDLKMGPTDRCIFRRLERPELKDFVLDDQFTDLIRKDPLTAIRMMSFEARVPMNMNKVKKIEDGPSLTVAHDALADTFGDLVYIRRDDNKAECPLCGDWADVVDGEGVRLECFGCGNPRLTEIADLSERWAGVRVEHLLQDGAVELFLPRAWNKNGNWIGRDELAAKYEEFIKEREDVRSSKG